ncbi:PaaI family thioesterase [Actinomadura roseirufa]|uniref:PaaI family thioesterase n=1 Tax=Actinomadura roseirufa TaxID=2094049 RepID=UPI001041B365|nr:PaaI family thioesterase [Actinomadura roseirufa]
MGGEPAGRRRLAADETKALAVLAARVRELTEATVLSGVDPAEVAAVADEVAVLTERLAAVRRHAPPLDLSDALDLGGFVANPVAGPLNPIAPPVDIEVTPEGVARAVFTLGPVYEGPPAHVHGGISAMVLDQVLGMAAAAVGTPGMTATLDLRYRRPTPLGVPLSVEAKATRAEGRRVYADGSITGPEGRVTVEASAMFVVPKQVLLDRWMNAVG